MGVQLKDGLGPVWRAAFDVRYHFHIVCLVGYGDNAEL